MSYMIVDEDGNSADLATNAGMDELKGSGLRLLNEFLDEGEINEVDVPALIDELEGSEFQYIAGALKGMRGQVVITNGIEED